MPWFICGNGDKIEKLWPLFGRDEVDCLDMTQEELIALLGDLSVQMRGNLGNLHLLTQGLITSKMREQDEGVDQKAAMLDQSFYQLLRLAENLSDAEYMTGERMLQCQVTDMVNFLGNICQNTQSVIWGEETQIRFQCGRTTLPWGINRKAMERVMYHLLSNGLKYTHGDVMVTVKQVKNQLELTVSDTGDGISPENIKRALSVGQPIDMYTDLKRGFGLGLPISCAIVRRHGGELRIVSQPGNGTQVIITLPKASKATLGLSDVPAGYGSTFNTTLVRLADALPSEAFGIRTQD